jgi:hypothetical protein
LRNVILGVMAIGALCAAAAFFASQHRSVHAHGDSSAAQTASRSTPEQPEPRVFGARDVEIRLARDDAPPGEPAYASSADIERRILQLFAERRPNVLGINSVHCSPTDCEVAFLGADANPHVIDAQADANRVLFAERWREFRILSGSFTTREIAPGAREYVATFTYQPLVDLSADPAVAARQQAACAAAWRRQTTNPTPDESVRQYLAIAEQHLALAAAVLGRDEAERIARDTDLGPLIRECGLQPPA